MRYPHLAVLAMFVAAYVTTFGIAVPLRCWGVDWMRARLVAVVLNTGLGLILMLRVPSELSELGLRVPMARRTLVYYVPLVLVVMTLLLGSALSSHGESQVDGLSPLDLGVYFAVLALVCVDVSIWAATAFALLRPRGTRAAVALVSAMIGIMLMGVALIDEEPLVGAMLGTLFVLTTWVCLQIYVISGSMVPTAFFAFGIQLAIYLSATVGVMVSTLIMCMPILLVYAFWLWRKLPRDFQTTPRPHRRRRQPPDGVQAPPI